MDWQALESRYTSGLYVKRPVTIVRGEGAVVWDDQGRAYIDCVAGHGVANIGHSHPKVAQAVAEQAARLITCPEMFYNDTRARLLKRLGNLVPGMDRVFLCNSGTEAVEAAIKFARFSTGRPGIVAAMRGFHGRTLGALSATWNKKYRTPFEPLVPGFTHIPFNKPEALDEAVTEETAAVILEVVQGEGGIHPATPEFLQRAQAVCQERGGLLIVDEIQSGMGRTGKLFAFQHYGVQPDLVTLAKGIAGGIPMGAVLLGERVAPLKPGIHGTTFGGNPVAAAASLAALEVLEEENLPQRAAEVGAYFLERLRAIQSPLIREVRGLGLMLGVELKQKVPPYIQALLEHGVLALPAGLTVIRFLPPLVITREQVDQVVTALEAVLASS
ncbi:MAG TPA: aspartate aminotransferase family protein [Anaerolineae bacterium]|nr:aspartate aminotransferase family protein [Anaerolineae bacterium]HID84087.1 aspartate aminotransferase family protein [Anaerolineales bacterium]